MPRAKINEIPRWSRPGRAGAYPHPDIPIDLGIAGVVLGAINQGVKPFVDRAIEERYASIREEKAILGEAAGLQAAAAGGAMPKSDGGLFEIGSRAYDRGARAGYLAGIQNKVGAAVASAEVSARHDPEAFDRKMLEARKQFGFVPPELAPVLDAEFLKASAPARGRVEVRRQARAAEVNQMQVYDRVLALQNEASMLTRRGDAKGAARVAAEHDNLVKLGVQDGLLDGKAAADMSRRLNDELAEQHLKRGFDAAHERGGYAGAMLYANSIDTHAAGSGISADRLDRIKTSLNATLSRWTAEGARADAAAERARQRAQDSAKTEILRSVAETGELPSRERMAQLAPMLDSSGWQAVITRQEKAERSATTDPEVYLNLSNRIEAGEDVRLNLLNAQQEGRLKQEHFTSLLALQRGQTDETIRQVRANLAKQFEPGQGIFGHLDADKLGKMMVEFDDEVAKLRVKNQGVVSRAEARAVADDLSKAYRSDQVRANLYSMPLPSTVTVSREALAGPEGMAHLQQAATRLEALMSSGQMSPDEYKKNAARIANIVEVLRMQDQK
jgi:hypothetical protein